MTVRADSPHPMRPLVALLISLAPVVAMAGPPALELKFRPDQPTLLNRPLREFENIVRSIGFFQGATWVGTYGRGAFVLKDGAAPQPVTTATSPLLENRVNCLEAAGDALWIGTCNGINRIDAKGAWSRFGVADGVAHNIYHAIRHDSKGHIWVGTTGKGVSRFDGKKWTSWGTKDGLPSGWVNDLAEDKQGRIWAATAGGVARFENGSWRKLEPTGMIGRIWSHATALAVRGDEIWVGTGGQGLLMTDGTYWYDPGGEAKLPSFEVSSLCVDAAGALWVGTAKGLVRYRGAGDWRKFGPDSGLEDPHLMVLREGGTPSRLWAGSYSGHVYRFDPHKDRWFTVVR